MTSKTISTNEKDYLLSLVKKSATVSVGGDLSIQNEQLLLRCRHWQYSPPSR